MAPSDSARTREAREHDKAIKEKFRKRKMSLCKKADELAYLCDSDVYLVIFRSDRFFVYQSDMSDTWPPSGQNIARYGDRVERSGPSNYRRPESDANKTNDKLTDTQLHQRRYSSSMDGPYDAADEIEGYMDTPLTGSEGSPAARTTERVVIIPRPPMMQDTPKRAMFQVAP